MQGIDDLERLSSFQATRTHQRENEQLEHIAKALANTSDRRTVSSPTCRKDVERTGLLETRASTARELQGSSTWPPADHLGKALVMPKMMNAQAMELSNVAINISQLMVEAKSSSAARYIDLSHLQLQWQHWPDSSSIRCCAHLPTKR
jgi:hypothetical protein